MNPKYNRAFLQVEIDDWCTEERVQSFKHEYVSHMDIFASCPQSHDSFIRWWIRTNNIQSLQKISPQNYLLEDDEAAKLVEAWTKGRDKIFMSSFGQNKIRDCAILDVLSLRWAASEWSHRLESIYLERKSSLDKISCSLIRTQDPLLAIEIYHRLRSDKIPFNQLSWQFGEGPERNNSGYFPLMRAASLPDGFLPLINKLEVGDILKPHRIGKWNVIIQLHDLVQAQFNLETQQFILKTELDAWCNAVSKVLLSSLE